jgi:hypothetical protein
MTMGTMPKLVMSIALIISPKNMKETLTRVVKPTNEMGLVSRTASTAQAPFSRESKADQAC